MANSMKIHALLSKIHGPIAIIVSFVAGVGNTQMKLSKTASLSLTVQLVVEWDGFRLALVSL